PDFFRMLSYVVISGIAAISAAIALAPFGGWIVAVVIVATLPRIFLRTRFGEMQWSMYGSGAPESRKLWYFGSLLSEPTHLRELKVFRTAKPLLARYRSIQKRIIALGLRPLERYRKLNVIAPVIEGAVVFGIAWWSLPSVTSGAVSVGSFAFFVTML